MASRVASAPTAAGNRRSLSMSIFPLRRERMELPIDLHELDRRIRAPEPIRQTPPVPSEAQERLKEIVLASDGDVAADFHELKILIGELEDELAESQADLIKAIDYHGEANSVTRRWLKTVRDGIRAAKRHYRRAPVVQTEAPAETTIHPQAESSDPQ